MVEAPKSIFVTIADVPVNSVRVSSFVEPPKYTVFESPVIDVYFDYLDWPVFEPSIFGNLEPEKQSVVFAICVSAHRRTTSSRGSLALVP